MDVPTPGARFGESVLAAVADGTCVTLVGLPGSGRSSLLQRVAAAADDDGRAVVRVPGLTRAAAPLESLVLAGLVTGPTGRVGALAHAVAETGRALGGGRSVLLLDDADALDDASVAVLAATVRQHGVTVVATARPPGGPTWLADALPPGRDATTLHVPLLAFEEIHALTADVAGGDVDADVAGRVYALSGGLPGVARTLVVEALRAGRLVARAGRWTAPHDLWTPAVSVVVDRLVAPLGPDERESMQLLAALGPAEVATVRRLLPWSAVVALEDHGLLRFLELGDELQAALFPPLLTEHLRHTGHGARGLRASDTIARTLGGDEDHRPLGAGTGAWSDPSGASSPESAAVLGRVLRQHAATRVMVCRAAWERRPSGLHTVNYLDALLTAGASAETIEQVLTASRATTPGPPHRRPVLVDAWEATYRALVLGRVHEALGTLDATAAGPRDLRATLAGAVAEHLRLVAGDDAPRRGAAVPAAPAEPAPAEPAAAPSVPVAPVPLEEDTLDGDPLDEHLLDDPLDRGLAAHAAAGDPHLPFRHVELARRVDTVVGVVRAETLLARGRVDDAREVLSDGGPAATYPNTDQMSLLSLALLSAGELQTATDRSSRLLEQARGTFRAVEIEPHGYVVALGLYLQGRLATLRAHLTRVFATGSPAPLRPCTHAGLLTTAALLSLLQGNVPSARSMVAQLSSSPLRAAFSPLARPAPVAAVLAVTTGADPRAAAAAAWDEVAALVARGDVLAAVLDASELATVWCDPDRARLVADAGREAQGTLLPALGRYVRAAAGEPGALLASADELRAQGLVLHATRAHAAAVRALRTGGDAVGATREASRLRELVAAAGDDLDLVTGAAGAGELLTARELEIARLVAQGATNRQIAERLLVSDRTVDNHVYRIFRKLGVTSRDRVATLI
ncbi:helix-turn-helix transcriptional regulator [Cellulomonas sp. Sa3CUA2]|uniref:Helix-turn-helix transcriptional regulator n=1 Tax=Cellulomonas avistercoris TaxID=2762242 RepID=A0ABR8QH39_9CELL|nr:LuxR C-terminal-related transcriptional regulator [Cellulomonas avistercoris]MBD7919746.1 helix-turn-helix transcriptional regulator [Cellulomonas avistercoris]